MQPEIATYAKLCKIMLKIMQFFCSLAVNNLRKLNDVSIGGISGGPSGVSVDAASCALSLRKGPVLFQSLVLPAGTHTPTASL